jgi:hypothetical protein
MVTLDGPTLSARYASQNVDRQLKRSNSDSGRIANRLGGIKFIGPRWSEGARKVRRLKNRSSGASWKQKSDDRFLIFLISFHFLSVRTGRQPKDLTNAPLVLFTAPVDRPHIPPHKSLHSLPFRL